MDRQALALSLRRPSRLRRSGRAYVEYVADMKVTDTLWTSTESLLTSNDSQRSSNDSLLTSTDSLLTSTDYTGFVKDCISFKPASCVTDRFLSLGCPDLSTFSLMYFLATSTTSVPKALRPASSLSGLSLGRGKNDLFIGRQTCHSHLVQT